MVYNEILRQTKISHNPSPTKLKPYDDNIQDEQKEQEEEGKEDLSSQESDFEFKFEATHLGMAIMKSGLTPEEGLLVYLDLKQANKGIILANELHQLYLLTPVSLTFPVLWQKFHSIFRRLCEAE